MSIIVDLQIACSSKTVPSKNDFVVWTTQALLKHYTNAELTIRLVNEAESRMLNETYRQQIGPTNVLSFASDLPDDISLATPLLGDLVICEPLVAKEAREQHKDYTAHFAHLVVHGCLHLLGYDHVEPHQAQIMESLETQIMLSLNFTDPYKTELTPC